MNTNAEAAVMLDEARAYIEKHGWVQHAFESGGRVCLLGALQKVDGKKHGKAVDQEAQRIVCNLIGGGYSIPQWNDASGRKKEDVLEILRAAAQCERELAS